MDHQLFTAALGLSEPWYVDGLHFDERARRLTVRIDFHRGARFAVGDGGEHPVHDTRTKRYRHLNFFQHECELEARVPRVRLPDGRVALCDDYGADIDGCAGDDAWYLRGRSIGNAGPATEVERKSDTLRLAGSFGGLLTFLNRTHDYDLGVSWSRSKGIMTDPGTYTERLFLAFRGYGGPDCGVGVIADSSSPAKMRLNRDDTAGKTPGQGAAGTSIRSATRCCTRRSTAHASRTKPTRPIGRS